MSDETREQLLNLVDYTEKVLDKKYQLRAWVATKTSTLVTINSILLGATLIIVRDLIKSAESVWPLLLAAACFCGSLLYCLHASVARERPPHSTKYSGFMEKNLRTSTGAAEMSVQTLAEELKKKDLSNLLEMNVDLIQRMNSFVVTEQRTVKFGVVVSTVGLLIFAVGFVVT